ncbi:MAG: hypothetical protein R3272_16510 [Candidatus Promineifilaceae bacterium]|nr:hypothetical protein [Candidatus Promineifilaceae bacterium]
MFRRFRTNVWSLFVLVLPLLLIVACQPAVEPEPGVPGEAPVDEEQVTVDLPEQVVEQVQQVLAQALGIEPAEITIVSVEQTEFPNACLGLAEPGELCAEVITPGFEIAVDAADESFTVRSDLEGTEVRVEELAAVGDDVPDAVAAAMEAAADQLGVPLDEVELLGFQPAEFPNACLGLEQPDEVCAQVITPGFQIDLGVEGEVVELRTDEAGEVVRIAPSG